jgi:flavorubredoxin
MIGSSTHDNDMLVSLAGFLEFLKGLKPKNRFACAFGSFGWAGGAVKGIENILKDTGIEIAQPGLDIQYVPNDDELKRCYEFGKNFAGQIRQG